MNLCTVSALICLLVDPALGFSVGEHHGLYGSLIGTAVGGIIGVASGYGLTRIELSVGRNQGRKAVVPFAWFTLLVMVAPTVSSTLSIVTAKAVSRQLD